MLRYNLCARKMYTAHILTNARIDMHCEQSINHNISNNYTAALTHPHTNYDEQLMSVNLLFLGALG